MPITAQDLENAQVDAETLGAFANGAGMVEPREGDPYPSVRKFLADNQTDIDDAVAAAEAQVQYIGRLAMIFRDGASTANAISTVTIGGAAAEYKITDLYVCHLITPNTVSGVTLKVDGLPAKPVLTQTGEALPVPAWDNNTVAFRYRADIDSFVMAFSDYFKPFSYQATDYVMATTATVGPGDIPQQLIVTPLGKLPNNTGFNTYFMVKFPADRVPELGMLIKVIGINDAELVGFYDRDTVSQVRENAWKAGDTGIIARDSESPFHFHLVTVFPRLDAEGGGSVADAYAERAQFYTSRNVQIATAQGNL